MNAEKVFLCQLLSAPAVTLKLRIRRELEADVTRVTHTAHNSAHQAVDSNLLLAAPGLHGAAGARTM